MRAIIRKVSLFILTVSCIAAITTCDTPFGLGERVNTEFPVINNVPTTIIPTQTVPGSFLGGSINRIYLNVQQEFGIDSVKMTIWYKDIHGVNREEEIDAFWDEDSGFWVVDIDTIALEMADGPFTSKVTAVDTSGKETVTTELIYNVKNAPPQVEMTLPPIAGELFDDPVIISSVWVEDHTLFQGSDIMGIATDLAGLAEGYPQIMIWPLGYTGPKELDDTPASGSIDREWGQWWSMVDDKWQFVNQTGGTRATQFRWPLVYLIPNGQGGYKIPSGGDIVELAPGNYQFKIRVKDVFGRENIYPNRVDNTQGLPTSSPQLNKYMEFRLVTAETPVIRPTLPQYYNGKDNSNDGIPDPFRASMKITSKNALGMTDGINYDVRARISILDSGVELVDADKYVVFNLGPPVPNSEGNLEYDFNIVIPRIGVPNNASGTFSGDKILYMEATDNVGNRTTTNRAFLADDENPRLEFIEPAGLAATAEHHEANGNFNTPQIPRVTSTVIIRGASYDNLQIKRVYYALGKTVTGSISSLATESAQIASAEWVDTMLHTATSLQSHNDISAPAIPVRSRWEGNISSWRWRFENVSDLVKDTVSSTNTGNYYVDHYGDVSDDNLWLLPIMIKVVDTADNAKIYTTAMILDPDADKPIVEISSHEEGQIVGGTVRIGGTARDNEMIYGVEVRIYKQTDAECDTNAVPAADASGGWKTVILNNPGSSISSWAYEVNNSNDPFSTPLSPPTGKDNRKVLFEFRAADSSIFPPLAHKQYGAITQITLVFNNTVPQIGELEIFRGSPDDINFDTDNRQTYTYGVDISGFVTLKTTVRDEFGISRIVLRNQGEQFKEIMSQSNSSNFNNKNNLNPWIVPPREMTGTDANNRILTVGKKYYIKYIGSSQFMDYGAAANTVDTTFIADSTGPLSGDGILIEANSFTNALGADVNAPDPAGEQYFQYEIYVPMDTNGAFMGGVYRDRATGYTLDVQVLDNTSPTPFMAHYTFYLEIDNYYPMADFTGYLNAIGSYSINGNAWDTGIGVGVHDLAMVVVYFSRDGDPISLREKNGGTAGWVYNQRARVGRTGSQTVVTNQGTLETLPFFPDVRQPDGTFRTSASGIVVDSNSIVDGFVQTFTGVPDKKWSVLFDTTGAAAAPMNTGLNDGLVTVNYVVFDRAGNASYYSNDIYVANNRPRISNISLGTDINGDNYVTAGDPNEYVAQALSGNMEIVSNFRSRNNTLSLQLNVAQGNGQNRYRVSYVTRSAAAVSATNIVKGNVYTINTPGNLDWINYGVYGGTGDWRNGITFVATTDYPNGGTTDGTSTVYTYTYQGGATEKRGNYSSVSPINFTVESFGSSLIPDSSPKNPDGMGGWVLQNDRRFLIKVYDSTISGGIEAEQLAYVVPVRLNIDNNDGIPPDIRVNPFYWRNKDDNSLYLNSKENGHIELEANLPAAFNASSGLMDRNPKVSGKVTFSGTASDNTTIGAVKFSLVRFGGGAEITAATFSSGSWSSASDAANFFENNGWRFRVDLNTQQLGQSGHTIDWKLDIDSSRISGVANVDNTLVVTVSDKAPVPNNSAPGSFVQTTAANRTAHYRIDVVPYISGISTVRRVNGGLKDVNIRSVDGKYSIIRGPDTYNDFITVHGFNLGPLAASGSVRILTPAENAAYNPASVSGGISFAPSDIVTQPYTSFTMTNNSAKSGYLVVVVNGIGTLNNINNNYALGAYTPTVSVSGGAYQFIKGVSNGTDEENMPNLEPDPYVNKNVTLTDDRYLRFFNVRSIKSATVDPPGGSVRYPDMIMAGDHPVFGYLNTAGGRLRNNGLYGLNGNAANGNYGRGPGCDAGSDQPAYAWPQRRAVDGNTGAEIYTEYLIKGASWDGMGMGRDDSGRFLHASTYSRDGGCFHIIYDRFAELNGDTGDGWGTGVHNGSGNLASGSNRNALALETVAFANRSGQVSSNVFRYQYPKIKTIGSSNDNTGAAYYLIYFDEVRNELAFRTFRIRYQTAAGYTALGSGDSANKSAYVHITAQKNASPTTRYNTSFINMARYTGTANITSTGATSSTARETPGATTGNAAATSIVVSTAATRHFAARSGAGTGGRVSKHFDFAVTSGNNVVVIFYDDNEGRLKVRYSSAIDGSVPSDLAIGPNAASSISNLFTDSALSFPSGIGQYVSMAMEGDALHIAALDSNEGRLVYLYAPSYSSGAVSQIVVDSYGNTGSWAQIKLQPDTNKPYISYCNVSETGSRDSIRLAYPRQWPQAPLLPGVDANGYATGDWEYMTMPALSPPRGGDTEFQKVNLGFRETDGQPVLGFLTEDYIEFGFPLGE